MKGKLFGTDGIRGTANQHPMTAEIAMRFAMAAGLYYHREGHRNRVIIAKDTRLSGYLIEPALTAGFISIGADVTLVGPMPTPAVSMLIESLRADFGVMISASHNPYQDNGLKLFNQQGHKLSDSCEDQIQEMILNSDLSKHLVASEQLGRAVRLDDARGRYIEHVKRVFNNHKSLTGLRIVVDCANGSAYDIAPTVLWELGAEVISIATEPNGTNINDRCGSTHPESLIEKVLETRADIGIALDGDADRCLICDENGKIIDGDQLIAVMARELHLKNELKNKTVVVTEMSNGGLDEFLNTLGIRVVRTGVGDRNVFNAILANQCNFGGEQSGHLILSDYASTGDGIVASLKFLTILIDKGLKASDLNQVFTSYPQMIRNIKFKQNNPLDNPALMIAINEIKDKTEDRIFVRKSGTEKLIRVMVEGKKKADILSVVKNLELAINNYCD